MLGDVEATSEKQNFKVVVDGGYFTDAKLHFSIETDGTWRFSAQWLRARRADFLSLALRRKRSRRAACRQPAARGPARNGALVKDLWPVRWFFSLGMHCEPRSPRDRRVAFDESPSNV